MPENDLRGFEESTSGDGKVAGTSKASATRASTPRTAPTLAKIRESLKSDMAFMGAIGKARWCDQCGTAFMQNSDAWVDSLITLAENDARVRKALENMMSGSGWIAFGFATVNLTLPIAIHHLPSVRERFTKVAERVSVTKPYSQQADVHTEPYHGVEDDADTDATVASIFE